MGMYDVSDNEMQFAIITRATSGELIATPGADQRLVIYGWLLCTVAAADVKWQHASTDFNSVAIPMGAAEKWLMDIGKKPHLVCSLNEALNINLSTPVQLAGWIQYQLSRKTT